MDLCAIFGEFGETWDEVISLLENGKPQDLIDAQTKIAENVGKDLAKYMREKEL